MRVRRARAGARRPRQVRGRAGRRVHEHRVPLPRGSPRAQPGRRRADHRAPARVGLRLPHRLAVRRPQAAHGRLRLLPRDGHHPPEDHAARPGWPARRGAARCAPRARVDVARRDHVDLPEHRGDRPRLPQLVGGAVSASASELPPFGRSVPGNRWDLALADAGSSNDGGGGAGAGADARAGNPEPRSVSVIVVHFEQQSELDRTLAALARQTHPAELLEVIVVDDGSRAAPRVPPGVRLLVQEDLGFRAGAARNLGARAATGDVLCFLDADTAPEPEYVSRMAALPSLLPEAVVAGHRKHADFAGIDTDAAIEAAGPEHELEEPAWLADAYRDSRRLLDADDRSYRFVIGAVFSCTRWFFDQTGGFDEDFLGYGGEDWEWAHRAWLAGAVLAYEPAAVAWHDGPDWAGRTAADADSQVHKNDETLLLSRKIGVDGSRPRALRTAAPDVIAVLAAAPSAGAAFVCVDSLLEHLPHASVVVPDEHHRVFGSDTRVVPASRALPRGRVRIEIDAAVRFDRPEAGTLQRAVSEVGISDLGAVRLGEHVVVRSERALRRTERWGAAAAWRTEQRPDATVRALPGDVSVAAHLGGWLSLD
ncbi:glycosyltransferase [Pseudoclavibacter sp. RFBI5]|nr:glycosyltransferase [Pseudoclavibacter sp. RFBI5]